MNLIGDLERLFATSVYPLRVPIAIALFVALVGFVVLARRRGWFAAARRHPRRSGSVIALALVIGLPLTWYLGSPLFIRSTLIEPATAAVTDGTPSGPEGSVDATDATDAIEQPQASDPGSPMPSTVPSASTEEASAEPTVTQSPPAPTPTSAPTAFAAITTASGSFRGADDFHFGQGTASIIETAPGRFTLRFDEFSVRNGPDLYVYLSPSSQGYADGVLELGTLKATDGSFGYELPAGTDPTQFASAVIWCKQFAVQFAVAAFEAA